MIYGRGSYISEDEIPIFMGEILGDSRNNLKFLNFNNCNPKSDVNHVLFFKYFYA